MKIRLRYTEFGEFVIFKASEILVGEGRRLLANTAIKFASTSEQIFTSGYTSSPVTHCKFIVSNYRHVSLNPLNC